MSRASLYTRVSTGPQDRAHPSPPSGACLKKAQELGAEVVQHYEETHSGGLYLSRAGIQAALADIKAERDNTLIIYRLDRGERDVGDPRDIRVIYHIKDAVLLPRYPPC